MTVVAGLKTAEKDENKKDNKIGIQLPNSNPQIDFGGKHNTLPPTLSPTAQLLPSHLLAWPPSLPLLLFFVLCSFPPLASCLLPLVWDEAAAASLRRGLPHGCGHDGASGMPYAADIQNTWSYPRSPPRGSRRDQAEPADFSTAGEARGGICNATRASGRREQAYSRLVKSSKLNVL